MKPRAPIENLGSNKRLETSKALTRAILGAPKVETTGLVPSNLKKLLKTGGGYILHLRSGKHGLFAIYFFYPCFRGLLA